MALKILLADDSPAIKKVVQLSLQDFGVELKTVSSGKDVIDVARQFKPHIAFIDVLLPQKSGYEIAGEMRSDAILRSLPIVLLWSAFMAFDEKKFKASGAQAKLEKPFEVQTLRSLVNELVPITKSNPIAEHLEFPNLQFDQLIGSVPPAKTVKPSPKDKKMPATEVSAPSGVVNDEWSMSAFQDISSFAGKKGPEINKTIETSVSPAASQPMEIEFGEVWPPENDWVKKDLKNNPASLNEEHLNFGDENFEKNESDQNLTEYSEIELGSKGVETGFVFRGTEENQEGTIRKTNAIPSYETTASEVQARDLSAKLPQSLTLEELSDLKKETRDIIEKVVWKLVPELAAKMIREEIIRLLSEEK